MNEPCHPSALAETTALHNAKQTQKNERDAPHGLTDLTVFSLVTQRSQSKRWELYICNVGCTALLDCC